MPTRPTSILAPLTLCGLVSAQMTMQPLMRTRTEHAIVFDSGHQESVLFGGQSVATTVLGDRWTRRSSSWSLQLPAGAPSLRGHGMAYVPGAGSAGTIVVFGGILPNGSHSATATSGGSVGTTWVFPGNSWGNTSSATDPSPRTDPRMAYDPVRNFVLMHGGLAPNGTQCNDTWLWRTTTGWVPTAGTAPLTTHPNNARGIAFSSATSRVTLIANWPLATYEFDGTDWIATPASGVTLWSDDFSVATAPSSAGVLVFGGSYFGSTTNSLTLWDGTAFSRYQPQPPYPTQRRLAKAVLDTARNRLVVQGGELDGVVAWIPTNDTWEWDGSIWHYADTASYPNYRDEAGLVDTPTRGGVFLDGGTGTSGTPQQYSNDSWRMEHGSWDRLGGSIQQSGSCIAYDLHRDRVVRFDGTTTWEHDGVAWSQVATGQPRPASQGPMVYHPIAQLTILLADGSWAWDGVQWTPWSMNLPTSVRLQRAGLVFDSRGNRLVLVTRDDGTWVYDGSGLSMVTPSPPEWRFMSSMVTLAGITYDPDRDRVLAIRTDTSHYGLARNHEPWIYEWDGTTWAGAPIGQQVQCSYPALAYSTALGASLVVCGSDTWILGSTSPAEVLALTPGCTAPATQQPTLSATSSGPWTGSALQLVIRGQAPTALPLLGVLGFSAGSWNGLPLPLDLGVFGMPSCTLHGSVDQTTFLGTATWSLGIPNATWLVGVQVWVQAMVLDPGSNALGALVTNGLRLRIGQR